MKKMRPKTDMQIRDSPIHGKGVFAQSDILIDTSWIFPLEQICCESHCFIEGITIDSTVYLGTFDWPFYVNSTWPDDIAANLSFMVDVDTMRLTISTVRYIKKGEELTLPYDWTIHKHICNGVT